MRVLALLILILCVGCNGTKHRTRHERDNGNIGGVVLYGVGGAFATITERREGIEPPAFDPNDPHFNP